MAVIDIGPAATDRASFGGGKYTLLQVENPANATGILTKIEVYAVTGHTLTAFKAGTVYGTAPNFTSRDSANLGDIAGGSKQTISGLSIQVQTDDLLGYYWASDVEFLERDLFGSGVHYKLGDQFGAGQQEYTLLGDYTYSVYGEGTTSVVASTVTTQAATDVETTTATGNGNITDIGSENCDHRGIVYGKSSQGDPGSAVPESSGYDDYEDESGSFGTGAFTRSLTGLDPGTQYYARAYAHNSAGYNYGGEIDFTTIITTKTKTYTADALFQRLGLTKTPTADTLFQASLIKELTSDARFILVGTKELTVDALLIALGLTETATADALFQKFGITKTVQADTLLQKLGLVETIDVDTLLQKLDNLKALTADVLFETPTPEGLGGVLGVNALGAFALGETRERSIALTADVLFKICNLIKEIQSDVLFQRPGLTKELLADSVFELTRAETLLADAIFRLTGAKTLDADVMFKAFNLVKDVSMDVRFVLRLVREVSADAIFRLTAVRELQSDALFKAFNVVKELQSDALFLRLGLIKETTFDVLLQISQSRSLASEVLFQLLGLTKEVGADAVFQIGQLLSLTGDSIFKGVLTESCIADSLFIRLGLTTSAACDAIFIARPVRIQSPVRELSRARLLESEREEEAM